METELGQSDKVIKSLHIRLPPVVNNINERESSPLHYAATPDSLPDTKHKGPRALMDPSDPYGMRWTVNNGSVIIDNDKNALDSSTSQTSSIYSTTKKDRNGGFVLENIQTVTNEGHESFSAVNFLRSRLSYRKHNLNRLVEKNGECNVSMNNIPKQRTKYFRDIFTTVVDMKWRWCLMLFAISFFGGWLFFAIIYYLIMLMHEDFEHQHDSNWTPCVQNIKNFLSIFMFSLETQHTIGYGSRFPTEECPPLVIAISIQSCIGIMIQTLLTGVVFAKLARPKKRAATLIFSKYCCICMRDGRLCLLFRVGDMRKSHLAEAHIRLQMISKRITNEGELLPFHQFDMNVGYDAGLDRIFVVWPITIVHVIDEHSPLYHYSADDLASARFEIIAILEGVVPSTGSTTQARTSYLPNEVLWGHRFEKLVTYQRHNGEYKIDFSKFDVTNEVDTPTLSAKEIDVMTEAGLNFREVYQSETNEPPSDDHSDVSPSEFVRISPQMKPSVAEIISKRQKSLEETANLLSTIDAERDVLSDGFPLIQGRKMSTLSNRLDRWMPTILHRALSNKSLNTIKSSGSLGSLTVKDKVTTVLREHDIM